MIGWIKRSIKKIPVWVKAPIIAAIKEFGKIPTTIWLQHIRCCYVDSKPATDTAKHKAYKKLQRHTYRYLEKKYGSFIAEKAEQYQSGSFHPDFPVWIFWWQGEQETPDIVKRCVASVRKHANNHPVYIITKDNYQNYVQIPKYIIEKVSSHCISLTHFSDILRMNLIAKHGGLWLDATIFCAKDFDEQLFTRPIFTGRNPGADLLNVSRWEWTGYAIYGWKGGLLFCLARDLFNQYWLDHNHLINYFLIDYTIRLIYDKCAEVRNQIDSIPVNNTDIYYFQKHFNDSYTGSSYSKMLKSPTWLYKLTWKAEYRMQTSDGQQTVYAQWCNDNKLEII